MKGTLIRHRGNGGYRVALFRTGDVEAFWSTKAAIKGRDAAVREMTDRAHAAGYHLVGTSPDGATYTFEKTKNESMKTQRVDESALLAIAALGSIAAGAGLGAAIVKAIRTIKAAMAVGKTSAAENAWDALSQSDRKAVEALIKREQGKLRMESLDEAAPTYRQWDKGRVIAIGTIRGIDTKYKVIDGKVWSNTDRGFVAHGNADEFIEQVKAGKLRAKLIESLDEYTQEPFSILGTLQGADDVALGVDTVIEWPTYSRPLKRGQPRVPIVTQDAGWIERNFDKVQSFTVEKYRGEDPNIDCVVLAFTTTNATVALAFPSKALARAFVERPVFDGKRVNWFGSDQVIGESEGFRYEKLLQRVEEARLEEAYAVLIDWHAPAGSNAKSTAPKYVVDSIVASREAAQAASEALRGEAHVVAEVKCEGAPATRKDYGRLSDKQTIALFKKIGASDQGTLQTLPGSPVKFDEAVEGVSFPDLPERVAKRGMNSTDPDVSTGWERYYDQTSEQRRATLPRIVEFSSNGTMHERRFARAWLDALEQARKLAKVSERVDVVRYDTLQGFLAAAEALRREDPPKPLTGAAARMYVGEFRGVEEAEVSWGKPYAGNTGYRTDDGRLVQMYRKGQHVRFYDIETGEQVGPEQPNVAPAMAAAQRAGWIEVDDLRKETDEGFLNLFRKKKPQAQPPHRRPGRYSGAAHKAIQSHARVHALRHEDDYTANDGTLVEVSPPGWKGSIEAMKRDQASGKMKKDINPFALAWSMKKRGAKSHYKADGTKKDEAEAGWPPEIDEKAFKKWVREVDAGLKQQLRVTSRDVPIPLRTWFAENVSVEDAVARTVALAKGVARRPKGKDESREDAEEHNLRDADGDTRCGTCKYVDDSDDGHVACTMFDFWPREDEVCDEWEAEDADESGTPTAAELNKRLEEGGVVQVTTASRSTLYRKQHAGWFSEGKDGNLYVREGKGKVVLTTDGGKRALVSIRTGTVKNADESDDPETAKFYMQLLRARSSPTKLTKLGYTEAEVNRMLRLIGSGVTKDDALYSIGREVPPIVGKRGGIIRGRSKRADAADESDILLALAPHLDHPRQLDEAAIGVEATEVMRIDTRSKRAALGPVTPYASVGETSDYATYRMYSDGTVVRDQYVEGRDTRTVVASVPPESIAAVAEALKALVSNYTGPNRISDLRMTIVESESDDEFMHRICTSPAFGFNPDGSRIPPKRFECSECNGTRAYWREMHADTGMDEMVLWCPDCRKEIKANESLDESEVANEILRQLGGNRFITMTGAKNLVGSADTLSMKVGRNDAGITHVRIKLDPSDTYTVTFLKVRGSKVTTAKEVDDVYADALTTVFTAGTGLATRLGGSMTIGRPDKDDKGDEDFDEAAGEPIFGADDVDAFIARLKQEVKAPFVMARTMSLGGNDKPTIYVSISADPKDTWSNSIFENSRHSKFSVNFDGTLKQITNYKLPKFRLSRAKSMDDVITRLNKWLGSADESIDEARVRMHGAEYTLVKKHDDGRATLRNDNGDEFDTDPGETWTDVDDAPRQRTGPDPRKLSRAAYVAAEKKALQAQRQAKLDDIAARIEREYKTNPLPAGISKVQHLLAAPRLRNDDRALRTTYNVAKQNVDADTRTDEKTWGATWDRLNAKNESDLVAAGPISQDRLREAASSGDTLSAIRKILVQNPGRHFTAKQLAMATHSTEPEAMQAASRLVNQGTAAFKRGDGYSLAGSPDALQLPAAHTSGRIVDKRANDYTIRDAEKNRRRKTADLGEDVGYAVVRGGDDDPLEYWTGDEWSDDKNDAKFFDSKEASDEEVDRLDGDDDADETTVSGTVGGFRSFPLGPRPKPPGNIGSVPDDIADIDDEEDEDARSDEGIANSTLGAAILSLLRAESLSTAEVLHAVKSRNPDTHRDQIRYLLGALRLEGKIRSDDEETWTLGKKSDESIDESAQDDVLRVMRRAPSAENDADTYPGWWWIFDVARHTAARSAAHVRPILTRLQKRGQVERHPENGNYYRLVAKIQDESELEEGRGGFKDFDDPWKDMSSEDRREAHRLFKAAMRSMPSSPRQKEFQAKLNELLAKYGISDKRTKPDESMGTGDTTIEVVKRKGSWYVVPPDGSNEGKYPDKTAALAAAQALARRENYTVVVTMGEDVSEENGQVDYITVEWVDGVYTVTPPRGWDMAADAVHTFDTIEAAWADAIRQGRGQFWDPVCINLRPGDAMPTARDALGANESVSIPEARLEAFTLAAEALDLPRDTRVDFAEGHYTLSLPAPKAARIRELLGVA